jgi:glycosyltransferase involved in cell wall biosynthesis
MSETPRQIEEIVPLVLVQNDEYWLPYTLGCIEGHFSRVVIYNVGSTDETQHIIENFRDRNVENTDILIRDLPDCPPKVQLCFRNSMISEARSDFYLILDGDEVYNERSVQNIKDSYWTMRREYEFNGKLYGIVRRIEICDDLVTAYASHCFLPHHRLYHRTAIWTGTHPGERPVYKQHSSNEVQLDNITCYHFHNCRRSRFEEKAQGRMRRKRQETYRRGDQSGFNVYANLEILHKQTGFPTHPVLARMQVDDGDSS